MNNVLVLGNGSIGKHLAKRFTEKKCNVITATRNFDVHAIPKVQSVLWCQGVNCNDSIGSLNYSTYMNTIDVNLHYITRTLDDLVKYNKLDDCARCLIISSLWQEFSREEKFSYTVSKAAIGGIVRSCSVDLGKRGIFINALLPGPLDNEMTRAHLTQEQTDALPGFVNVDDLWYLTDYLCLHNTSTNGQSIIVDLGFSVKKM